MWRGFLHAFTPYTNQSLEVGMGAFLAALHSSLPSGWLSPSRRISYVESGFRFLALGIDQLVTHGSPARLLQPFSVRMDGCVGSCVALTRKKRRQNNTDVNSLATNQHLDQVPGLSWRFQTGATTNSNAQPMAIVPRHGDHRDQHRRYTIKWWMHSTVMHPLAKPFGQLEAGSRIPGLCLDFFLHHITQSYHTSRFLSLSLLFYISVFAVFSTGLCRWRLSLCDKLHSNYVIR